MLAQGGAVPIWDKLVGTKTSLRGSPTVGCFDDTVQDGEHLVAGAVLFYAAERIWRIPVQVVDNLLAACAATEGR